MGEKLGQSTGAYVLDSVTLEPTGQTVGERAPQTTGAYVLDPVTLEPTGQTVGERATDQNIKQDTAESEEWRPYGLDLIDVKEIKLDTQEGHYDYLTSLVDNDRDVVTERLRVLESGFYEHICEAEPVFRDLEAAGVSSLIEDTQKELDKINAKKRILENLDFSNSSVIEALKTKSEQYYKEFASDGMSEAAATNFYFMYEAANELYLILLGEIEKRAEQDKPAATEPKEINKDTGIPKEVVDSTLSQEATEDVPSIEPEEKPVVSYDIEGGLLGSSITVLVGQEIPEDWFIAESVGEKGDSGFGITIERSAPINGYLQSILNTEYGKIDEAERKHYDYTSIMSSLEEEAQRTKKIPDVAAVIRASRK